MEVIGFVSVYLCLVFKICFENFVFDYVLRLLKW